MKLSPRFASLLAAAIALGALCPGTARATNEYPRPNLLLAVADDWSFGHAGAYGCGWVRTPAFDRVAREGLLFTRAYTPNAKCAPSRACLLTGRNPWQLKAAANHVPYFPPEFRAFPEALAAQGFFVGYTAKGWGPGIATNLLGEPRAMTGRAFNAAKARPPAAGVSDNDYASNFAAFLKAAPAGSPWCFWFGSLEPHRAYEPGAATRNGRKPDEIDRVPRFLPDRPAVRADLLDYALEVEHFDAHLGRMLAILEHQAQLTNTLVVVTSDNGMPFPRAKGQVYEASNHLPLALMWPAGIRSPGRTIDQHVSFIDLAPTFLEVAGLPWAATGMAPSPGRSLTKLFNTSLSTHTSQVREHVLLGKERHDVGRPHDWGYPVRGLAAGDWLYLRNYETTRWPAGNPETGYLNCDGSPTKSLLVAGRQDPLLRRHWDLAFGKRPAEELYDLRHDPDCLQNLAQLPGFAAETDRLRQLMVQELRTEGDPRMEGKGEVFEHYLYADPSVRGFHERWIRGERPKAGWVEPTDFDPRPVETTDAIPESPAARAWSRIRPHFSPPTAFDGDYGTGRSPLLGSDGSRIERPEQWPRRRAELLAAWQAILGAWPESASPARLHSVHEAEKGGLLWRRVRLGLTAGQDLEGWLLLPLTRYPRPAVLVVYYEPETSVGLTAQSNRDLGLQLAKRGFVTLSLGTPGGDARNPDLGGATCQPLAFYAWVAARAWQALAALPEVDPARIGITGHSYGGKWALFGAAFWERFAAVAVSDPGVVFDETRPNVNYWDPWYLGAAPGAAPRSPGLPDATRPRTGAYRRLVEEGRDLVELHALLAPRPFLVSGGAEDPPERWRALNHLVALNRVLGVSERAGMTQRTGHDPTPASNAQLADFFESFLGPVSPPTPSTETPL